MSHGMQRPPGWRPAFWLMLLALGGTGAAAHAQELPLLDTPAAAVAAQQATAARLQRPIQWTNSVGLSFQLIPPGRFRMGCAGDADAPVHEVTLTEPYYLGTHEVTRAQWEQVTGLQRSRFFPGADQPINFITWYDASAFLNKLNKLEQHAGYRLPTEAQWEYAARAGVTTLYPAGDDPTSLDAVAWTLANSAGSTHPVGQKAANAFGLHDMLGNVWEWCSDAYDPDAYRHSPRLDPTGPAKSLYGYLVLRGGSVYFSATAARLGKRAYYQASRSERTIGFRVLLPINPDQPLPTPAAPEAKP